MKLNDLAPGFVVSSLVWLILSLILIYCEFYAPVVSLVAAFALCILSFTVFILTKNKDKEISANMKNYEKTLKDQTSSVNNLVANFNKTIALHNMDYENFSKRFFTDFEIYSGLKAYTMIWVYKSAIGKLRDHKKEKAQEQIKQAEQIIRAIINNPLVTNILINEDLNSISIAYKKLRDNPEKQLGTPPSLYHRDCNHDLVCKYCDEQVRQGDFGYRAQR